MSETRGTYTGNDGKGSAPGFTGADHIEQRTCSRCDFTWYPRTPNPPHTCANPACRSPYWDRPRRAK